jgi:hypothetical protein
MGHLPFQFRFVRRERTASISIRDDTLGRQGDRAARLPTADVVGMTPVR